MTITSPKKNILISLLEGFFAAWAFMKAGRMEPGNILTGILFFLCSFVFYHIKNRTSVLSSRREHMVAAILAVIFTLLYMMVDYTYYIETLTNRGFQLGILFAVFLGFFFTFRNLLLCCFSYTKELSDQISCTAIHPDTRHQMPIPLQRITDFFSKHIFVCSFLICMLGWLPYFLYEYPGIMTPDSINQFEQVLGVIPASNHHPWIHTMLIKLVYSVAHLFTSDLIVAVSVYTFFQMSVMGLIAAYMISTLSAYRIRPVICGIVLAFYALVPYNAVFAVTIWKDILFAGAVLLFTTTMFRLLLSIKAGTHASVPTYALYALSGLMICLFRSNGWYAFLLSLPFLLFGFCRQWKIMFPLQLGIFLLALLVRGPVMNAYGVTQPDFVESLSIPLQQVAAVICNDKTLTDEQWELVHNVIDTTYIKELYDPTYADNIKELVRAGNPSYLESHKEDYLKLWLQLGLTYPGSYLKSYISQTYGYWYPDSFYHVADTDGVSGTDLGIIHTPLIRGTLVIKAKEISIKMGSMIPIYSLLWSMGIAFWVFLTCIGNSIVRKDYQRLLCYLPTLAIFATVMIATPVAYEFRYVYFMVYTLPFYLFLSLTDEKTESIESA